MVLSPRSAQSSRCTRLRGARPTRPSPGRDAKSFETLMTLTQGRQPSAVPNRPVIEPWRRPSQGSARGRVERPISDLSTNLTVEHFSEFDGLQLQANTFYWIDLTISGQSDADNASIGWGVTDDDSGPGVAEEYNSSEITDFTFFPNAPTPPPNNGGPIFQMEVSAAAAPSLPPGRSCSLGSPVSGSSPIAAGLANRHSGRWKLKPLGGERTASKV